MKIVTNSAADMPAVELEAFGVVEAPLYIQFPEGEISSADISAYDFYDRLRAMRPAIPTTAQPSSGVFAHDREGAHSRGHIHAFVTRRQQSWCGVGCHSMLLAPYHHPMPGHQPQIYTSTKSTTTTRPTRAYSNRFLILS